MEGPALLDHDKLRAWRENRDVEVLDWEITVLLDMDEAYIGELLTPTEGTENGRDR